MKEEKIEQTETKIDVSEIDEPSGTMPCLKEHGKMKITDLEIQKDNWSDWHWQLKNSIKSVEQLENILSEKGIVLSDKMKEAAQIFPVAITPYYLSLIKEFSYSDPIFSMCMPNEKELINPLFLSNDPLGEEHDSVIENLVHRYNDRVLLVSTNKCPVNCRYCTRKRVTGSKDFHLTDNELDSVIKYIKNHPEIKDVIISGGDPFTMSTSKLENIISKIRAIDTVEIIRIGTKTPVTLPMRITDDLVKMISKYHPVWINTHFNHPNEITEESKAAILKLVNNGIPVNNQNVLLKGINDNSKTTAELYKGLLKIRVRPYYLFQCDLVKGIEHFRTSISKGIKILSDLRGRISGLGIPHYIVDSPNGKGKIPLLPNYVVKKEKDKTILKNYKGEMVVYPEPNF